MSGIVLSCSARFWPREVSKRIDPWFYIEVYILVEGLHRELLCDVNVIDLWYFLFQWRRCSTPRVYALHGMWNVFE